MAKNQPNMLVFRRQNGQLSSMAIYEPEHIEFDQNVTFFPITRPKSPAFNFHGQMGDHQYDKH